MARVEGNGIAASVRRAGSGAIVTRSRFAMENMLLRALFLMLAVSALSSGLADAAEPRPPRPYRPVEVTLPPASEDASLEAFRNELAAVAKGRLFADLARLTVPQALFWDRDFANTFDFRKGAADNLAMALRLEHHDGAGWLALAAFATETSAGPMPARPGVLCAPAPASFDEVAFDALLRDTATVGRDWRTPRADKIAVRAEPKPGAAAIGAIGLHFVRLMGFEGPPDDPAPSRNLWARVVMPSGATGYVAPGSLMSLDAERLCYAKDPVGRWRIAGYVGRRD